MGTVLHKRDEKKMVFSFKEWVESLFIRTQNKIGNALKPNSTNPSRFSFELLHNL